MSAPMAAMISMPRSGRWVKLSSSQARPSASWILGVSSTARRMASSFWARSTLPAARAAWVTFHARSRCTVFLSRACRAR